jgi:hypothetical protein
MQARHALAPSQLHTHRYFDYFYTIIMLIILANVKNIKLALISNHKGKFIIYPFRTSINKLLKLKLNMYL